MISHYLCGGLCHSRIKNSHLGGVISRHRQVYNLGTQGPDFLFYYIPCLLRPSWYRLGNVLHSRRVGEFFRSLLEHALKLEGERRESALAYICGYLSHYALDTNAHPYIYYKAGFKTQGDTRPSLHYSVCHQDFETQIDTAMLKLISNKRPADKKLWQLINTNRDQSAGAASVISDSLQRVYGVRMSERHVRRAMSSMVVITRVLQSRSGRRKRIISSAEELIMPASGYLSSLIHDQEAGGYDYLNLGRKQWSLPWEKPCPDASNTRTLAFTDMFRSAVDDSARFITELDSVLRGASNLDSFLAKVGNLSFSTGRDCTEKLDFVHHGGLEGLSPKKYSPT